MAVMICIVVCWRYGVIKLAYLFYDFTLFLCKDSVLGVIQIQTITPGYILIILVFSMPGLKTNGCRVINADRKWEFNWHSSIIDAQFWHNFSVVRGNMCMGTPFFLCSEKNCLFFNHFLSEYRYSYRFVQLFNRCSWHSHVDNFTILYDMDRNIQRCSLQNWVYLYGYVLWMCHPCLTCGEIMLFETQQLQTFFMELRLMISCHALTPWCLVMPYDDRNFIQFSRTEWSCLFSFFWLTWILSKSINGCNFKSIVFKLFICTDILKVKATKFHWW